MATQIKLRRDTYQNWFDNNPVLGLAEPGFDTTNKKLKIGDGVTAWNSLAYFDDKETVLSAVTQDIIPDVDNTYNLGSPSKRWQHGYFATGSLYVGDIKLSNNNGTLVVQQVTDAGLISEAAVNTPGVVTTDRIVNGANTFAITSAGALELNGSPFTGSSSTGDWAFSGNAAYNGTNYDQGLYFAPGGESTSYVFVPGNSESSSTALQLTNGSLTGKVAITAYNKQWQFDANGSLVYPNYALQTDTGTVQCLGNASTVVYTATGQYQHTIKLLIQVEGVEGVESIMDTQACEMIIAKSFRANALAASVYGVVHTSVAPLATFTANWNALTGRVEVICTAPSSNSVNVRIFATEITTSD